MIKTRPEILETITDKLNNPRWHGSNNLTVDDVVSAVAVDFIDDSVRATFNPAIDFRPKFFQVLMCAV